MKKMLCLILALVLTLSLTACGTLTELMPTEEDVQTKPTEPTGTLPQDATRGEEAEDPTAGEETGEAATTPDPTQGTEPPTDPVEEEANPGYRPQPVDGTAVTVDDFTMRYSSAQGFRNRISANVAEENLVYIDDLTDNQLSQINATRADMMYNLYNAFAREGLAVTMDKSSGIIAFDPAVLFVDDTCQISEEGYAFLAKFIDVYTTVVFHENYMGFVCGIVVEGHTANDDAEAVALAQERAEAVKAFCLEEDVHLSQEYVERLNVVMMAQGMGSAVPALNRDGSFNQSASTRIAFRFEINLNLM